MVNVLDLEKKKMVNPVCIDRRRSVGRSPEFSQSIPSSIGVLCRTSVFFQSDVLRLLIFHILPSSFTFPRGLFVCSWEWAFFLLSASFLSNFSSIIKMLLPFLWATEKRTLYDKVTAAVVEHRYGRCCRNEDADEQEKIIFSRSFCSLFLARRSPFLYLSWSASLLEISLAWSTLRLPRKSSSSWNTNAIMWLDYGVK